MMTGWSVAIMAVVLSVTRVGGFAMARTPSPSDRSAAFEGLLWFGMVVVVVLLGVIGLAFFRRRSRASLRRCSPAFTLEELRDLHGRGHLTSVEYQVFRREAIENAGRFDR